MLLKIAGNSLECHVAGLRLHGTRHGGKVAYECLGFKYTVLWPFTVYLIPNLPCPLHKQRL